MVIEELQRACWLNSSIHADGVFRKHLGRSDLRIRLQVMLDIQLKVLWIAVYGLVVFKVLDLSRATTGPVSLLSMESIAKNYI